MQATNTFISYMLSPAVLISGIGLLLLGINTRFLTITARIRELNKELRDISKKETVSEVDKIRLNGINKQVSLMLKRCLAQKFSIFFLYIALTLTVLTVFALAADVLNFNFYIENISIMLFITSLSFICVSLVLIGFETALALKTVKDDFINSTEMLINPELIDSVRKDCH